MQTWEAIEYCTGLICASLIHLKPLIKTLMPGLLGSSRSSSPRAKKTAYHAPRRLFQARDSAAFGVWEGQRNVRSVITAARSGARSGGEDDEPTEGEIPVRRDLEMHDSFHDITDIVQEPRKALLRGLKTP